MIEYRSGGPWARIPSLPVPQKHQDYDFAVVGGGLVGASIAWGLARAGKSVAVLDEGDCAYRASRGNFSLVWVQGKGLGMPHYASWTKQSSDLWQGFSQELAERTGIDVHFERQGGFIPALTETEMEAHERHMIQVQNQPGMQRYEYEMIGGSALRRLIPHIGPEVAGAIYCPFDGHANSLKLLRALHTDLRNLGASYLSNHNVKSIEQRAGEFRLRTESDEVRASKIILAAGHGNTKLGPAVGLSVPIRPTRGNIIVTEKTIPFLKHLFLTIRQTDEGGILIGDSVEDVGFNDQVNLGVCAGMAERATKILPILSSLNVVRTWAALRIMTKDGFPIYDQSETHPGAFIATCHSGVTLAAIHALVLAPMIAGEGLSSAVNTFSARRFNVSQAA